MAALFYGVIIESLVPATWLGTAIAAAFTAVAAVVVARWSSASAWTIRHTAAIALGVLLARGLAAFTYLPLIGDVSGPRKYTHNVVMLLVVLAAGYVALRRSRAGDESIRQE